MGDISIILFYIAGFIFAVMALLRSRTPQGTIAWVLSLITIPFLSVPLYIIFGRSKFEGYSRKRKILDSKVQTEFEKLKTIESDMIPESEEFKIISNSVSIQNQPGFTRKNNIKLIDNPVDAYAQMLAAIDKAKHYIVFQFYIIKADSTGQAFIELLIKKARQGVRVTFMNDAIGAEIPKFIFDKMVNAGIKTGTFNESRLKGKFQINFRNHRKILVIDGLEAFIGGINIGDEYRGITREFGPWRDTCVRIEGPSVIAAQLASAKDWFFIHEQPLAVDWVIKPAKEDVNIMVLHTGPADEKHSCLLSFIALINSATKRLWIANPYYVPPESLMNAILLACMRGVDVRFLVPSYSDSKSVMLASQLYQKVLLKHGARVYRYTKGFLHQKVMVVDNNIGVVGTVNFDCRSMFINFEVSVIAADKSFADDLAAMLLKDYEDSEELDLSYFENATLLNKIIANGANLMAPIL